MTPAQQQARIEQRHVEMMGQLIKIANDRNETLVIIAGASIGTFVGVMLICWSLLS